MTIKTNVITLNSKDAEQVWTQNVIDIILLLCPFSACCICLRCNNEIYFVYLLRVYSLDWKQWSFRKTGTMGTLASQAEIGVWVQAPGPPPAAGVRGYHPRKIFEIARGKSCDLVHFGRKTVRNAVDNSCTANMYVRWLNTLTVGTPFACVTAAFKAFLLEMAKAKA